MNIKKDFLYCWISILVLCLITYWIQVNIYLHHDVAIISHTAELMLQGQTYTHGIIEPNPPMIFYLNFLPIIVSKLTEIPIVYAFRMYVIMLIVISLACSNLFLKMLFLRNSQLSYLILFVLACILLFLPVDEFGQREHFFLILTIPYILLVASRLEHKTPLPSIAVLVGIMAGIGFSIKPYFLVTLALVELLVIHRKKVTPQVRHPERVFLREGSPGSGTVSNLSIGINLSVHDKMH